MFDQIVLLVFFFSRFVTRYLLFEIVTYVVEVGLFDDVPEALRFLASESCLNFARYESLLGAEVKGEIVVDFEEDGSPIVESMTHEDYQKLLFSARFSDFLHPSLVQVCAFSNPKAYRRVATNVQWLLRIW